MRYLFEVELPKNKSLIYALRYIYGMGKTRSVLVCKKLGFSSNLKVKDISKDQTNKLVKFLELLDFSLALDLRKSRLLGFKKLVSIKSFRGLRKYQGLPVRGQRTHTNAKTASKRK